MVIENLSSHLNGLLGDHIEKIHPTFCVTFSIGNLLIAVEKYFGESANYAMGKGNLFYIWLHRYHKGAYVYPVSRACGGTRQDIGVKGAVAILMNIPLYLEFLVWRLKCGLGGILEKNLFSLLQSSGMVALLRLLSILHISICLPLRWLVGHCGDLADYGFGVADMSEALDMMDSAFEEIVADGELMLDEDFMMGIFNPLQEKIRPFKDYMEYMFEGKLSAPIGCIDNKIRYCHGRF